MKQDRDAPAALETDLDLLAREFNGIDELQDCAGDCGSFQTLDGILTAEAMNLCLRGRSRHGDCHRCLEVCPFDAIRMANRGVTVDHALCRGCGGCALVCPTEAIRMVHPSSEELIGLMRQRLEERPSAAGGPRTLIIREAQEAGGAEAGEAFEVDRIGQVRLELLLFALLFGADKVVVACGPQTPPRIREIVRLQADLARAILRGLGMSTERVGFVVGSQDENPSKEEVPWGRRPGGPGALPKTSSQEASSPNGTRSLVRRATQLLYQASSADQRSLPLPTGSAFGAVAVTAAACTLCMACVGACPSGALSAGNDAPRLTFTEVRCHQCGFCESTCPEGALRRRPRMLCDPEVVDTPIVLHEAEAARCLACGVPFAPQAVIDRMRDKLQGHWMYVDERQVRRLQLCATCRARDAVSSKEVLRWRP